MKPDTLQQRFMQQIHEPRPSLEFINDLIPCGTLSPSQQISIYQSNAFAAKQAVLRTTYPVCEQILGTHYFKQLSLEYIRKHPSLNFDLNVYGESMPVFLSSLCQLRKELAELPYMRDLAHLEWHYHRLYFVANPPAFNFSHFAEITAYDYQYTRFKLAGDCFFMSSEFPLFSIWQSHINQQPLSSVNAQHENLCIFRQSGMMNMALIDNAVMHAIQAIKAGHSLQQLHTNGLHTHLPFLIQKGWVCGFRFAHVYA